MDFKSRIAPLLGKSENGEILVELARDNLLNIPVGYCLSSVVYLPEPEGEIDSLYIEPQYRGMNIGHNLVEHALNWMELKNVITKKVVVATGNESAIPFYGKFGFFSKFINLEQKRF